VTAVSHPEQPSAGDQTAAVQRAAEPPGHVPAETPAEITTPLPPVPPQPGQPSQPGQPHRQDQVTVGLPLLDLLAPQQAGPAGAQAPPARNGPPPVGPPPPADPPGLVSGLMSGYGSTTGPPPLTSDPYAMPGYSDQPYQLAPPPAPRRRGRPGGKVVAGLAAGVLVLAVLGIWALGSSGSPVSGQQASRTPAPTSTPIRAAGGYQFTQHAARTDTDCAANAYGKVAEYFRGAPCAKLDRALYTTTVDGRLVVVSVAAVRLGTEQAATELKRLADANGTGNVSDLLRAGVRVPNGPDALTDAGYAAFRDGSTVVIAEADFTDPAVHDGELLDRISQAAIQLGR
jgi:hypothetical protein